MSESLNIEVGLSKEEAYRQLAPQIEALVAGESDLIAGLANFSAALKQAVGFFWVGFYLVKDNELILGPFQGEIACSRIKYGRGVCGTAWKKASSIVVANVDDFPDHIACSSSSRSEIAVPLIKNNKVVGVLDVDSDKLNAFDSTDQKWLEKMVESLIKLFP